ncbi:protein phosphatase 1F-like isoform X1 [Mytilus californianus]|uniref:protein phosphatase 1F-like isoform X1 n=1 Tax=Mytilus californianus TaxID=6549 RepID=UPI0022483296|nr:protein phosphatase 1F-like isoform X1 [Mytilus californianus]
MMESTYANDNESFKKFLLDFCTNVIVETEESEDLPFRLVSKQLTPDELEAETLEWSIRYLSKYHCPHTLTAAISRSVHNLVRNIDVSELQESKTEEVKDDGSDIIAEEQEIVLDANKVCDVVIDCVHDVCKLWKDELPELSPPQQLLYACTHEIKNTRRKMEDRHVLLPDLNTLFDLRHNERQSFYAVFDGHAGIEAANYAAAHVPYHFVQSSAFPKDPEGALKAAFKSTDEKFIVKAVRERIKSGSTGVLAFIDKNKLHISWVGDSQAVLVKNGRPVTVMNPHKPERADERVRIQNLGGYVLNMGGVWRVNGMLSVSRAIGDLAQKKFISSDADVTTVDLDGTEDYLILACDGLWDVVNFDKVVQIVYEYVQSVNGELSGLAKHLVLTAKDLGSSDNITVTVVFFKPDISPPQIPQLFNFGISESQGKTDSNDNASPSSDGKGNNSDKSQSSNNQSDSTSGKAPTDSNETLDIEQSEFISTDFFAGSLLKKPVLMRKEPVFIIDSTMDKQKQPFVPSPMKLESQHSTIMGFRQQFETISVTDLRDHLVGSPSKNHHKMDVTSTEVEVTHVPTKVEVEVTHVPSKVNNDHVTRSENHDTKENIYESEQSSLHSGYTVTSKHSEPYFNQSIFSPRKNHHSHRRRKKDHEQHESSQLSKRSRRQRELSPIIWNFTGITKPSVHNYKMNYGKTSTFATPRYSLHSQLSETPITVRQSLPDLSVSGIDKYKSSRTFQDFRQRDSGTYSVSQFIDMSPSRTVAHVSKSDTSLQKLPKIKVNGTQSDPHSSTKFSSTWKPKRHGKMISGNMSDAPPTPLDNRRLLQDRQN